MEYDWNVLWYFVIRDVLLILAILVVAGYLSGRRSP